MLANILFALPLGGDSAAVCTAYGATSPQRVTWRRTLVVCLVLATFEATMPGVGMLLAGPVGSMIGDTAHYFAALLLVGIGLFMLLSGDSDDGGIDLSSGALLAVGLAVSVDEVAVGVSMGLNGTAFLPLAATIFTWVMIATVTGVRLGARVPERFHAGAAVAASVMLIGLGVAIGMGWL